MSVRYLGNPKVFVPGFTAELPGNWRPGAVDYSIKKGTQTLTIIKGDKYGQPYFVDADGDKIVIFTPLNVPISTLNEFILANRKLHVQYPLIRMTDEKIGEYDATVIQPKLQPHTGPHSMSLVTVCEWRKDGSDANFSYILANAQYSHPVTNVDLSSLKAILASIIVDPTAANKQIKRNARAADEKKLKDKFTFTGIRAAVLLRLKTIDSLNRLQLDTIMYEYDNRKFPDMSSAATVSKALEDAYGSEHEGEFNYVSDRLPFNPNPALSNLPVPTSTNNGSNGQGLPINAIEYYQAKPLADGSRCICYADVRNSATFVSRQTWSELRKLPTNRGLPSD